VTTPSIALDAVVLDVVRQRRSAGESLKALAVEFGVTWQKLDKAIRNGLRTSAYPIPSTRTKAAWKSVQAASGAVLEVTSDARPLPLTEKYRPQTLAGVWGQPKVVTFLRRLAKSPCSMAVLFEGETGTGKTSAALAFARELGCDTAAGEWGGVWEIASGEQTADAVRETGRRLCLSTPQGSGWKVLIVNEADRMCRPAEVIWLDLLEHLPRRSIIVFTTNDPGLMSARFRDRCTRLAFRSDAAYLAGAARDLLLAMWKAETGRKGNLSQIEKIVLGTVEGGQASFRRAVQALGMAILSREGDES